MTDCQGLEKHTPLIKTTGALLIKRHGEEEREGKGWMKQEDAQVAGERCKGTCEQLNFICKLP